VTFLLVRGRKNNLSPPATCSSAISKGRLLQTIPDGQNQVLPYISLVREAVCNFPFMPTLMVQFQIYFWFLKIIICLWIRLPCTV